MPDNKNPIFSDEEFEAGIETVSTRDRDESSPEIGVKPSKFRLIVWGVVAMFAMLAVLFVILMVIGNQWLYGEQDTGPKENVVNAVDPLIAQRAKEEAERVRIGTMNEVQKAQERIDTLESYIRQIVGTLENTDIQKIIQELDREKRERLTNQSLIEQMLDENSAMRRMIEELQSRVVDIQAIATQPISIDYGPPEEIKEEIPISVGPTQFLNNLAQVTQEEQQRAAEAQKDAEESTNEFDARPGIPIAGLVKAVLTTRIVSTQNLTNFFVQAQTMEDVEVHKGYWLPRGAVFYGKALPDMATHRIGVTIEGVRVGHIQYPMHGVLLDKYGAPGIVSKYVDPFWRDIWLTMLPQLASIFALDSDSTETTTEATDSTGTSTTKTTGSTRDNAIRQMGVSLSQQIAEHSKQNQPIVIVDSGLPVIIQFTEKLPLDLLVRGGGMTVADGRRFPQDNPFAVPREETVTVGHSGQRILGWNGPVSDPSARRKYQDKNPKTTAGIRGLWMGSYSDPNEKTPVSARRGADGSYVDNTPYSKRFGSKSDPDVVKLYQTKPSSKKNERAAAATKKTKTKSTRTSSMRRLPGYDSGNDK